MTMYPTYGMSGLGGSASVRYRQALTTASGCAAQQSNPADLGTYTQIAYTPPRETIENAGIRTGEITAIRAWDIENGLLRSVYMNTVWKPGEILHSPNVTPHWGAGIHAFKTLERARDEYKWVDVFGEVSLWGDVIEFEHGWKAEYAKIIKIYCIGGPFKRIQILRLRRKYGVE